MHHGDANCYLASSVIHWFFFALCIAKRNIPWKTRVRLAARDKEMKPQKEKEMVYSGAAEDKNTRREIVLTYTGSLHNTIQSHEDKKADCGTHTHTFFFLSGVDRRIWNPLSETDGWIEERVGQLFKGLQKHVDWKSVCFSGCLMQRKTQTGPSLPPFYGLSFVLCLTAVKQHSSLEGIGMISFAPYLRAFVSQWPYSHEGKI